MTRLHADRAVLFDLDGTLLDTSPDLAGAINEMRSERGMHTLPLAELAPMCSFGARGMLDRGLELAPEHADYAETYERFIELYRARMTRETRPYAGVRELIQGLYHDGWTWGIVTNKVEALALPLIAHIDFQPAPACIIGGDSAAAPKPDPAPLLLACDRIGIPPARCIYVGDSNRDVTAGHAAGMPTIGVAYGYIPLGDNAYDWPAEHIAATVADLRPAINALHPAVTGAC